MNTADALKKGITDQAMAVNQAADAKKAVTDAQKAVTEKNGCRTKRPSRTDESPDRPKKGRRGRQIEQDVDSDNEALETANNILLQKQKDLTTANAAAQGATIDAQKLQIMASTASGNLTPPRVAAYQSAAGLVADLVLITENGTVSLPLKVDLSRQQKQDNRDMITVSRDTQGNVTGIDLTRFDGMTCQRSIGRRHQIVAPASAAKADPIGAKTGDTPGSTLTPKPTTPAPRRRRFFRHDSRYHPVTIPGANPTKNQ
ncbi:MAG: hypothetical protein WDN28_12550 [Chthoniobacter sp.]